MVDLKFGYALTIKKKIIIIIIVKRLERNRKHAIHNNHNTRLAVINEVDENTILLNNGNGNNGMKEKDLVTEPLKQRKMPKKRICCSIGDYICIAIDYLFFCIPLFVVGILGLAIAIPAKQKRRRKQKRKVILLLF